MTILLEMVLSMFLTLLMFIFVSITCILIVTTIILYALYQIPIKIFDYVYEGIFHHSIKK